MRSVQRLLLQLFLIMGLIVAPNAALVGAQSATLTVKPASAPAGTVVTVSGTGMQPGERVNLRWDSATGTSLAYVTATSSGTFSRTVTIPTVAVGTYAIFAYGGTSKITSQTGFTVIPPATLTVNPASGPAGTVVTVSGTDMQPGEVVTIRWESATGTSLGTVTATSTGTFSRTVTIPTVAAGTYAIFAKGGTSKLTVQTGFTVEASDVPTLAVDPASAPAGTVVTVSGTDMQPGESVTIRWESATGTSLGTVTATSSGTYSGQVTIPTVAVGTYAIFAKGGTSQRTAQTDFVVQAPPTLAVKPATAPAGTVVTVSGTGMQPGERVKLRWGSATGTVLAYVTATSSGTFSRTVTIPTVAAGTYAIVATGGTSQLTAQTDFTVMAPATLTVNPASAPAGTVVTVSGTGMQPGEQVTLRWGSSTGTVLGTVTATSTGTFSGQVTIPATAAPGTYAIVATGATSDRSAEADFTVEAPAPATLTVNPASGPAGTVVTVSGTGMQPGEQVTIRWGSATGTVLGTVTATSTGTYSGQVTIPATAAPGTYAIVATGATSNRSAQIDFVVEAPATVTVNPASGPAGTVVTVSGTGMQPGEQVTLRWGSATGTVLGTVTATSSGTYSGQVTIPATAAPGTYAIVATGSTSNRTAQTDFVVEAPATLAVNPSSGPAGTVVTVSGTGMQPGEQVTLRWGSSTGTVLGTVTATSSGTYSGQVTVPDVAPGTYSVFAKGGTSDRTAQTDFTVEAPATLTVNPASGPAGTVVTVSGTGMQPGEVVTIRWESATGTSLGDVTATSTGTYSGQVTIPTVAAGSYVIVATGSTSNRSAQTDFVVEAPATVTVNPASGPAGTVVTVSGTGMQPGEQVTLRWGSSTGTVLGTVTATSSGTFSGEVTIPATAAPGTYAIVATGGTSDRTAQTDFVVQEPATLAVNPSSAPAGTEVTVSGTGMQPGETVTIRWGSATGTSLGTVTATSTGTFSGQVTIPTVAPGTYAIVATGGTSQLIAQTDFTVEAPATLTVNPASGPAGTVVTVSGTGMQPGETVTIRWGSATGTVLGTVTATSTGNYSGQVTVPAVAPGTYSVFADGGTSQRTAQTDFVVQEPAPATLTVNPASGPAGTVVTVSGTGMQPGESVTIRWESATGTVLGTVTATSTGTFSGQVTIPATAAPGTYAIVATGATSDRTAQTDFVVEAPATVNVNPASAPAGTVVTVSGTGMQPGEQVTLRWGSATGTVLGTVTATSTGTFSGQVTIPATAAPGTYAIVATGATSNRSAQTDFVVEEPAPATLTVNPASAPAGTVVTVSGTGMQPGESVTIRWGSATGTSLGTVTATSSGTYSGQVTIPTVAAGTYAIVATGSTSNRTAQTDFTVEAPATVTVNPASGPAGTVVTVSGTGMQPGEVVNIRWGSATGTVLGTVTATSTGTYSGQVTIPTVAAGTYAIFAIGATSNRSAQTDFTVEAPATLAVNPASAPAGTVVTVSGTGMQPGEQVTLRWGSSTGTVLGTVTATSSGTFSGQVTIPTVAAGTYAIVANGATSNRSAQTDFTVEAPATVTVNPASGPAGTVVTVSGTGMQPGEQVTLRWESATGTVLGTVTATSTGTFSGQVTVPDVAPGTYSVFAKGSTSDRTAQTDFVVEAPATLAVNPASALAGTVVTVSGTGMQPGEQVTLRWGSATGTVLGTVTATSTGTFSGQVTIPATATPGTYVIVTTGATSQRTAQTDFVVEAPATLTVNPSSAPAGTVVTVSGTGMQPGEQVTLRWGSATGTVLGTVTATSTGTYSGQVTIPTVAAGTYAIFATGGTSDRTAQTDFVVEAPAPASLTVNPASGPAGTVVTVSGTGMQPGEVVTIRWGSATGTSLGTVTATSSGTYSGQVTIPSVAAGTYAIVANGTTSNRSAQTDFVVQAPSVPTVTVNPSSAPAGTVVTVSGTGMQPGETVTIRWASATGTVLGDVTATSTGTFSVQVTIPARVANTYRIYAEGATSKRIAQTNFTVEESAVPTVTVNPSSALAGTAVTVSGAGMQPGEVVKIRWGSSTGTVLSSVTATSTGTYSGQVTIPTVAAGSYVIFVDGATSQRTVQTDFIVQRSTPATLTVTPATARPAETLQVTGSGYGPGETVVIVWVWPNTVAGTITATSTGSISGQIPMNTTGGPIKAVGRTTGATGEDSVTWTSWTPTLTTTTTTVSIGQVITFNGQGYLRNETVRIVTTRADGTHLELAQVVATSTGTISGQITIPAMGGSYLPIDARGVTSDAWASLELYISGPTITLSPNEGVPGDIINLTGSGFTPGERVNAYRHHEGTTTTLLGSTNANASGTVSMSFTFPACSTSNECYSVVISATGESSQKSGSTLLWLDYSSQPAVNRTAAVAPTETPAATGTAAVAPTETPAATGTPAVVPTETPAATGTPAIEEPAETPTPEVTPTETVAPTEVVLPSPTPEPTQAPAPLTYDHVFSIVDDAGVAVPGACVQLHRADGSLAGEWCDASIDGVNDGLYPVPGLAEGGYTIRLTALPADITFIQDQYLGVGSGMETSTVLYVKREPVVEPTPTSTEAPGPTETPEPTPVPTETPEPTPVPVSTDTPVPTETPLESPPEDPVEDAPATEEEVTEPSGEAELIPEGDVKPPGD